MDHHGGCDSEGDSSGGGVAIIFFIFHVRGDEAVGETEIVMVRYCVVLCSVGMGCMHNFLPGLPFLHRISTRAMGGIFVKPAV